VIKVVRAAALGLLLASCAGGVVNPPINAPLASVADQGNWSALTESEETVVGVAFSGGGMRASAFSYGVLRALDEMTLASPSGARPLTEAIDFVGGVSGGSVTAAYFGLKGRDGLADFRRRFLEQDAEQGFDTNVSVTNVLRIVTDGGVNDGSRLPGWLDANLFDGATYADLFARRRPIVWITASDLYNRVPFVFEPLAFNAICSDLSRVRLADAVAASAAVPGVFMPINVENFGPTCGNRLPRWMERALTDRGAAATLRASAQALARYRDEPERQRFIKLLDGGLTDNFGIMPIAIARTGRDRAHIPLPAERAARLKRFLFLVVDSGRGPAGDWTRTAASPGLASLAGAVTDAAIDAGTYKGYDFFRAVMADWEADLRRWRCSLSTAEVLRLRGTLAGWSCADVTFSVGRVAFEDAGPELKQRLDQVPTRFKLEPQVLDTVVEAGALALRNNPTFRGFLGRPAPRGAGL
jgi:NTE family protein